MSGVMSISLPSWHAAKNSNLNFSRFFSVGRPAATAATAVASAVAVHQAARVVGGRGGRTSAVAANQAARDVGGGPVTLPVKD